MEVATLFRAPYMRVKLWLLVGYLKRLNTFYGRSYYYLTPADSEWQWLERQQHSIATALRRLSTLQGRQCVATLSTKQKQNA